MQKVLKIGKTHFAILKVFFKEEFFLAYYEAQSHRYKMLSLAIRGKKLKDLRLGREDHKVN